MSGTAAGANRVAIDRAKLSPVAKATKPKARWSTTIRTHTEGGEIAMIAEQKRVLPRFFPSPGERYQDKKEVGMLQ
jgi:hypothetical protein